MNQSFPNLNDFLAMIYCIEIVIWDVCREKKNKTPGFLEVENNKGHIVPSV